VRRQQRGRTGRLDHVPAFAGTVAPHDDWRMAVSIIWPAPGPRGRVWPVHRRAGWPSLARRAPRHRSRVDATFADRALPLARPRIEC
jgi:hypothetical protein